MKGCSPVVSTIVGAGVGRRGENGLAVGGERPRAGDHRGARLEQLAQSRAVLERDRGGRDVPSEARGERVELARVSPREHEIGAAPLELVGDKAARVAGRAVDGDRAALLGTLGHREMLDRRSGPTRYRNAGMQVQEIMTAAVVTADADDEVREVARLMRDQNVGSVVICDPDGAPAAMITDRDLATRIVASERDGAEPIGDHVSTPLVTAEPVMGLEEAAALMVQHRVRRLPVVQGDELLGIVTLDDIAVRTGDLDVAQRMTHQVIEGALPEFFFHERG